MVQTARDVPAPERRPVSFGSPGLLATLAAVPLAAVGYALLERARARRSRMWARPALQPNMVQTPPSRRRHVPPALFLLALAFLLVGFARPQRTVTVANSNDPTVVVLVDVSGSMAARDVAATRVAAASSVAKELLRRLPARDRVAVMTFGNRVQVPVPPTHDVAQAVAHLPARIVPKAGTSLGDALSQAIAVVTASAGKTQPGSGYPGAVLVFTDGVQTAGGTAPPQAAETAFIEHVPIYTVAVGTTHGTVTQPVSIDGFDTTVQYSVPVDGKVLRAVARTTSGRAFALASPADAQRLPDDLRAVYRQLHAPAQPVRHEQALSAVCAALALALVAAAVGTSLLWFGRMA
jgi:Ca-activated chloride channel family protein